MRQSRSRAAALAVLGLLLLPMLPVDDVAPARVAEAQSGGLEGLLPPGIQWQDWQATHLLYLHAPASNACPPDTGTATQNAPVVGDRNCKIPLNTSIVSGQLPAVTSRTASLPNSGQQVPDTQSAWFQLEPSFAQGVRVNGLGSRLWVAFTPALQSCSAGLTSTLGNIRLLLKVTHVINPTDAGNVVGEVARSMCPVDDIPPGQTQAVGGDIFYPLDVDVPIPGGSKVLGTPSAGGHLQVQVTIERAPANAGTGGEWKIGYDADSTPSHLRFSSPDAFQFAAWTELFSPQQTDGLATTVFPVPQNPADRVSVSGLLAFKTAFGGYDNAPARSTVPRTTDAKWRMSIKAPDGHLVNLNDPPGFPWNPGGTTRAFRDCNNAVNDFETCLDPIKFSGNHPQQGGSPFATVYRMPTQGTIVPGNSHTWNYTRERIALEAPCPNSNQPCGGQFLLQIEGGVRTIPIATRLSERGGVPFTIGGVGVTLAPLRGGDDVESLSHRICVRTAQTQSECAPGQTTTFLLNITNTGPRPDNYTLTSEVLSASPENLRNEWRVAFGGKAVRGADLATLEGGNSSVLRVTVTPPAGQTSGSATVRVRATSQNAPDQFDQKDLQVELAPLGANEKPIPALGLFVFPDEQSKTVRPGQKVTFNYTIWNRGTNTESFTFGCEQGPEMGVDASLRRNDDSWNGTLSIPTRTIACRDPTGQRLSVTIPPGDVREAVVTLEPFTATAGRSESMTVVLKAETSDTNRVKRASTTATLELRSSFKLFILTDGSGTEEPFDISRATRVLRFGKDNLDVAPNADGSAPASGSGGTEGPPAFTEPYDSQQNPPTGVAGTGTVSKQHIDLNYSEFAFYRIMVVNDGDSADSYDLRVASQRTSTLSGCGTSSFTYAGMAPTSNNQVGMGDTQPVIILKNATRDWASSVPRAALLAASNLSVLSPGEGAGLAPGKSAVFYLRVHNEWNRHNISLQGTGGNVNAEGMVCDSVSEVDVEVATKRQDTGSPRAPFKRSVKAVTLALNKAVTDPVLARSVVLVQGRPMPDGTFESENRQPCPPFTAPDSSDRFYCKYLRPNQTTSWYFTATRMTPIGDDWRDPQVRRMGGLSLTELRNRGWNISEPCILEFHPERGAPQSPRCFPRSQYPNKLYSNQTGDEVVIRVDVTAPANATLADTAPLELFVQLHTSGASKVLPFVTAIAPKFKLNVTRLTPERQDIHPGDRAAIALNISNEGSGLDIYSISVPSISPGFTPSFQPNETRVAPSRNKTVTVFIHPPATGDFANGVLGSGTIKVRSLVNLTELRDETVAEVPFFVFVKDPPNRAANLQLSVNGSASRPVESGRTLTFTLNVTNPSAGQRTDVLIRRVPGQDLVPQFVDGWHDAFGQTCLTLNSGETKTTSFRVTAAPDALEGTHVTYILRADAIPTESCIQGNVQPRDSPNFQQTLVTAQIIGKVGLEVLPLEPVKVVPRAGSASFPVRIRNVGTAADLVSFETNFVNQSQTLPPNAWTAEVRTLRDGLCPSDKEVVQNLFVDPGLGCIVFVNVTAPLNIPQTGVVSEVEFRVTSKAAPPVSVLLRANVQDHEVEMRLRNNTLDAIPGQTLFVSLNLTNKGNGIDTFDVLVDPGGLAGYWNVSSELSALTLLNGTSKDIQLTIQVPKDPLPTTGAVIGITVRSRLVEGLRPAAAESLGLGSPLLTLLNGVQRTGLVTVNLYPTAALDVDGDRFPEIAVDRNKNALDGFELFVDPFTGVIQAVDLLVADGDGDRRMDHFIDINLDGRPDRYWDPDLARVTPITFHPDVNNDGTLEFLFDSDADLAVDRWVDPATRLTGEVIEKDFDGDGSPEFLIDTTGDGRPDKYFDADADKGPRGLVTNVQAAPSGNPQQYAFDTTGGGRPTRVYDRVTGEVFDARVQGAAEFVANYWYVVLLGLVVVGLAAYFVVQRRRGGGEP